MNIIEIAHAGVITDAPRLTGLGINILNFLLSVVGILDILMMTVAGIMYLVAAGDEKQIKKAKATFQGAVIGMVMIMGAFVVIKTIGIFFK